MSEPVRLPVEILHASPGRIRLRVRRADLESTALLQAERAIARLTGVSGVRQNPLTRSLVISFDPQEVGFEALIAAVGEAGIILEPSVSTHETASEEIRPLNKTITAFCRGLDDQVRERTGGSLDARTVVPIGLAALAVRELLATGLTAAPWYVLFWYSFDSFLKLRKPDAPTNEP